MRLSRTASIGVLAAVLTTVPTMALAAPPPGTPAGGPHAPADGTLRQLAQRHDLAVGTAVDMAALSNDGTYREKVASEFSSVTAENVMKWESLEPQRGVYTYEQADELVDFAQEHGQSVRGHVLVWHNQNPAWVTEGDFTDEELRQILKTHVQETVRHFKGQIWQWDVVNEVFTDDGQLRNSIWLQQLGPGYIADAFRWAHEADPKAKLFLNDYNVADVNAKSDAYYELAKQLLAEGVPVDGFGVQGHHQVTYAPTSMRENLQRFADLGLDTAVTEADVRMDMPSDDTKLQAQANVYRTMLSDCLAVRSCISFTVWGFTDRYSWIPGVFEGQGAANILDEDYRPKPAYRALQDELATASGPRHRD
jgi:endo-1,4-beta-xylanase